MSKLRYPAIATLLVALSMSSCTCQRDKAPVADDVPKVSDLETTKPKLADSLKVTPAERPEPEEAPEVAAEPPPLPDDFPEDIPVVEDAEVAQVQDLANDAHNVIFVSQKPTHEVVNFYRKKLEDTGWKVTQDSVRAGHAFVGFKRGNMIANLQVGEDPRYPGKRLIAIMYEEEKPLPFDEF